MTKHTVIARPLKLIGWCTVPTLPSSCLCISTKLVETKKLLRFNQKSYIDKECSGNLLVLLQRSSKIHLWSILYHVFYILGMLYTRCISFRHIYGWSFLEWRLFAIKKRTGGVKSDPLCFLVMAASQKLLTWKATQNPCSGELRLYVNCIIKAY